MDRTPPDLISMDPPSNSVHFAGDRIVFEFSERVDEASFERAFTVVPELTAPPELDWGGRRLEMTFTEPLPDATTFVFTIDNGFRDAHNVSLKEPIVRALATGSAIDQGKIQGRLLDPWTGSPVAGLDVIATRVDTAGPDAAVSASYRTQTGPEGRFSLEFLPEAPFFVYAFEDRNRSRSIDPGERFAVPPFAALVPAVSDSLRRSLDWWVVNPDTTAPEVTGVRVRSSRRIEVRYSEPVRFDPLYPEVWAVRDTLTGEIVVATGVYSNPTDDRRVVFVTDSLPPSTYGLQLAATVRDSAGNESLGGSHVFAVTPQADTVRLRFLRFDPEPIAGRRRLTARKMPRIQFNQFIQPEVVRSVVAVSDTSGASRSFEAVTDDGVNWRLKLVPSLDPGEVVNVEIDTRVAVSDTVRSAQFSMLSLDETGSFSGYVESGDSVIVEIYKEEGRRLVLETVHRVRGDYRITQLESGDYRVRTVQDTDGDGMWDWGRINPYRMPERVMWYPDSARARAGWETVLDTLRFARPE